VVKFLGKIVFLIVYSMFFVWAYDSIYYPKDTPDINIKDRLFGARRVSNPKDSFDATYVSNYDADTITVNIDSLPKVFGQHIAVRVKHIDSPEITSKDPCARKVAIEGKEAVQVLLSTAKSIKLVNVERDKYFRLLAEVIINETLSLHTFVLENDYAISYEGDAKLATNWCK